MKRSRLVLVVILVAVAVLLGSLWVGEGPLWRLVMLRDSIYEGTRDGHAVVGHDTIYRFTGELHGDSAAYWAAYYQENGFKALEEHRDGEVMNKTTMWGFDGRVKTQIRFPEGKPVETKDAPPWWWGVQDQTEPTAPWWGKE